MSRFRDILSSTSKETLIVSSILIFNLFFIFSNFNIGYNVYDDGIAAFGATRVLHGEIPYRDFWACYAPGNFYLEALLFKIFGENLLTQRIYGGIAIFLLPFAVWLLTKKILKWQYSMAAVSLSALSFGFWGPVFGMAFVTGGLLLIFSIYFVLKSQLSAPKKDLFLAGVFTGCTALFKHEFGITAFVSIIAFLLMDNSQNKAKRMLLYFLGAIGVILPVGIYFLSKVPLSELFDQFVRYPLEIFPDFKKLPFPGFEFSFGAFPFYYPLMIFGLTIIALVRNAIKQGIKSLFSIDKISPLLLILGSMLFFQASARPDNAHMFSVIMVCVILSMVLASKSEEQTDLLSYYILFSVCIADIMLGISFLKYGASGFLRAFLLVPLFIIFVATILAAVKSVVIIKEKVSGVWLSLVVFGIVLTCIFTVNPSIWAPSFGAVPGFAPSMFAKANGILVPSGIERNAFLTVEYLKMNAPQQQKIFIGGSRHDILSVNNILIYFFAGYGCATRYHELDPGVVTAEKEQIEIISELKESNVNYIVLKENLQISEPNKSSISSGVRILDNFIRQNYQLASRFGPYYILKIKPPAISQSS